MQRADINHKTILIRINELYHDAITPLELYEATRGVWRIGERREQAELAMSVFKGEVIEVYRIQQWHRAGTTKYQTRDGAAFRGCGRWEFVGEVATDVRDKYIGKSVRHYLVPHNSNPIVYVNVD
jgi:hypothetical protein